MDLSAFDMCQAVRLPILVFNYKREAAIERAMAGLATGTLVRD
jgi:uridylate kinase